MNENDQEVQKWHYAIKAPSFVLDDGIEIPNTALVDCVFFATPKNVVSKSLLRVIISIPFNTVVNMIFEPSYYLGFPVRITKHGSYDVDINVRDVHKSYKGEEFVSGYTDIELDEDDSKRVSYIVSSINKLVEREFFDKIPHEENLIVPLMKLDVGRDYIYGYAERKDTFENGEPATLVKMLYYIPYPDGKKDSTLGREFRIFSSNSSPVETINMTSGVFIVPRYDDVYLPNGRKFFVKEHWIRFPSSMNFQEIRSDSAIQVGTVLGAIRDRALMVKHNIKQEYKYKREHINFPYHSHNFQIDVYKDLQFNDYFSLGMWNMNCKLVIPTVLFDNTLFKSNPSGFVKINDVMVFFENKIYDEVLFPDKHDVECHFEITDSNKDRVEKLAQQVISGIMTKMIKQEIKEVREEER